MAFQHSLLTGERWSKFSLDQQILMIATEMNRGRKLMAPEDRSRLTNCYERVLQLVDLTVAVHPRPSLVRELLLWRDLIVQLYVNSEAKPRGHDDAFRCLLTLTPTAYQQLPLLLGSTR